MIIGRGNGMYDRFEKAFQRRLDSSDAWYKAQTEVLHSMSKKDKFLLFGMLVLTIVVCGVLFCLGGLTEKPPPLPKTDYPDSILTAEYKWPDGARIDNIAGIDGYAVAYSEKGYFAVFQNGMPHHMLYANGSENGVAENRIYSVNGNLVHLYDAEGNRTMTVDAVSFRSLKKHTGGEAEVDSYVYRITNAYGAYSVVVETNGKSEVLLTQRGYIKDILFGAGTVCFLLGWIHSAFRFYQYIKKIRTVLDRGPADSSSDR